MADVLESFSPAVREWFRQTFAWPTAPQVQGWPPIQRGEHTLILAPTGSGKTLAAFLWGIDELFQDSLEVPEAIPPGIRLLYVSPLKALNYDIERNLRVPLRGIHHTATELGLVPPKIRVAVRTGDTPQSARSAMLRQPPHILITTPESLYLMLTAPRARELFQSVRTVIVDEIHTVCGNKRGVHLAVSLERLEHLADQPIQRIGLSATQKPLEEVARFLGGAISNTQSPIPDSLVPRPVTIVDASHEKKLDLQVVSVVRDFRNLPAGSIWPVVIPRLLEFIRQHRTTLIFCNGRRQAERVADQLNEQLAAEQTGKVMPGQAASLSPEGVATGVGFAGAGIAGGPIRAHHGSVSKEVRCQMEEALKAGQLPALVATSSLELGIDIGAVDLVVQIQSPKAVAQGLQRVGRSGHLVGQTSKGRVFPLHREDVMEAAAVARGMLRGDVEETHTPKNPLDVLAQQIVAMVSVQPWDVDALYRLVRQAHPYHDLSPRAYHSVLDMLAGKYPSEAFRELRPQIGWDRVHNVLHALPGSRLLAIRNGGTIPDRGTFSAYLTDGKTRIGELDEEFVYETRVGDVFMLGSRVWRAVDVTGDRVVVADASGSVPRMPFWKGDLPWRAYELGQRVGAFRRQVAERLKSPISNIQFPTSSIQPPTSSLDIIGWLQAECALDENSAHQVVEYTRQQLQVFGDVSSDRTIIVETFEDALGDPRMVVHSPFGGRVNGPWGIALASALRERTGVEVEVQTNDDGILLRFPGAEIPPPLDVVQRMTPAEARERILRELPDSPLFGAQFRMNAQRALLLPRVRGGNKRTPFWLQRLRAKDLLAIARQFEDFPIIIETYRDCLRDVMDLAHLEEVLAGIQKGEIRVITAETVIPSPVAAGLLRNFIAQYMYEWDAPKAERQLQALTLNRELLEDVLGDVSLADVLKPEAISEVQGRLQHVQSGYRARTVEELAQVLYEMGDLSDDEIVTRSAGDGLAWIQALADQGRVAQVAIATSQGPALRWVAVEHLPQYQAIRDQAPESPLPDSLISDSLTSILRRYLHHSGPVTAADIRRRYGFPEEWLEKTLAELVARREIVQGHFSPEIATSPAAVARPVEYCDRRNLEQIHRRTLTLLRQEIQPVSIYTYADFLTRWQRLHPAEHLSGQAGLTRVLQQLRAAPVPGVVWERDVLSGRLTDFVPDDLEALCRGGELIWVASGGKDPRRSRVRFLFRGEGNFFLDPEPTPEQLAELSEDARGIWDFLKGEGACFFADLEDGLELPASNIEDALTELVMAGLVTNDSLEAMRHVIERGLAGGAAPRQPFSTLEADLAERLKGRRRLTPGRYRDAKRRVARRLREQSPGRWVGRWSLVHRFSVMGKPVSKEERAERQARQLLARHGVVTRESLEREEGTWDWGSIYRRLVILEMRGEVRRGYFIAGLSGTQFALPEAVEQLRAANTRRQESLETTTSEIVVLNACDPANVFGPEGTGAALTFARLPSNYLVLWRGEPVLLAEGGGSSLTAAPRVGSEVLRPAVQALVETLTTPGGVASLPRRVTVLTWNGDPVLDSAGQAVLEAAGFYRAHPGMEWSS